MEQKTKSILELIEENIVDGRLNEFTLPDAKSISNMSFAWGAMDGIRMYHTMRSEVSDEAMELLVKAVNCFKSEDFEKAEELFAACAEKCPAMFLVDALQQHIVDQQDEIPPRTVFMAACYLAFCSTRTDCVKIGLELMELFPLQDEEMKERVRTLGLCDEFTLYALWCMAQWDNRNEEIYRLAQKVRGWGRVHAVERLQPETEEIRRWLLFEGTYNEVLPNYSALICWEKSGAAELLAGEVTREEYAAISKLLDELQNEEPEQGFSGIEEPEAVLQNFFAQSERFELSEEEKEVVEKLRKR